MNTDMRSSIGECSRRCLDLFSESAVAVRHFTHDEATLVWHSIEDESVRFKLWASNIGVFADVHASLDFRVRELPDVAELFLRQLDTIEFRLDELHENITQSQSQEKKATGEREHSASPVDHVAALNTEIPDLKDWDSVEIFQSIHQSIDWLHRLSNMVRKASFANQNKRARDYQLRDSEGIVSKELTEEMITGLRVVYKHIIKCNTESLEDYLADRLIETMVTRHRQIMYRRSRQVKWALSQVKYKAKREDAPEGSQKPHSHEAAPLTQMPEQSMTSPKPPLEQNTIPAQDKATTVNVATYRKSATRSRLSRASSAPLKQKDQTLIPPTPMAASKGEEFVCPYCCLILRSQEAKNSTTWAKHVQKDLDPYICVFEGCSNPYQIYSTSKEWLSHMSTQHRMGWHCFATDHEPLSYDSPEEFEEHMKTKHAGSFPENQLSLIVEVSAHSITPILDHCPFCSNSEENMEEHVGQHLREFALHSLPWPDAEEKPDGGSPRQSDDTGSMNTRETVKETRGDNEPLIFDDAPNENIQSTESESRLSLYGYLDQVRLQHEPPDTLEMLNDTTIATFARIRYMVDSKEALVWILSRQPTQNISTAHLQNKLQTELLSAEIESSFGNHRTFIPEHRKAEIITFDVVAEIVQSAYPDMALERVANYVTSVFDSAKNLFTVLAMIKRGDNICDFLDGGASDSDLPFDDDSIFHGIKRQKDGELVKSQIPWSRSKRAMFAHFQWSVLAPIFCLGEHKKLDSRIGLPFSHSRSSGYSIDYEVFRAEIPALNHEFGDIAGPPGTDVEVEIVKLDSSDYEKFWQRREILIFLNKQPHHHLVKLLASYEYMDCFHLVFPGSISNLREYWQAFPAANCNKQNTLWMLKQMKGIMHALHTIHSVQFPPPLFIEGNSQKLHDTGLNFRGDYTHRGLHKDIKAENILVFEQEDSRGVLQMFNFRLHNFYDVHARIFGSPTYEPPECYLSKPVTQAYDIWSIGCSFLEFISWLLSGFEAVEAFSDARTEEPSSIPDNPCRSEDYFWTMIKDGAMTGGETRTSQIRSGVVTWVEQLHQHSDCSLLIHDLLDLIMGSVLRIEAEERITAIGLHNELEKLLDRVEKDERYLTTKP